MDGDKVVLDYVALRIELKAFVSLGLSWPGSPTSLYLFWAFPALFHYYYYCGVYRYMVLSVYWLGQEGTEHSECFQFPPRLCTANRHRLEGGLWSNYNEHGTKGGFSTWLAGWLVRRRRRRRWQGRERTESQRKGGWLFATTTTQFFLCCLYLVRVENKHSSVNMMWAEFRDPVGVAVFSRLGSTWIVIKWV